MQIINQILQRTLVKPKKLEKFNKPVLDNEK